MALEIHYREDEQGIEIVRCYGNDTIVTIPEYILEQEVTRIASYAFSSYKGEEETEVSKIIIGQESIYSNNLLCGDIITEIRLPKTVFKVGAYAFYGCSRLKVLWFSNRLADLGAGLFIDCKIEQLHISLYENEQSYVKYILDEMKQQIHVEMNYIDKSGNCKKARLCFPEYMEEERENGPARIFETKYHGLGYKYRQCFYRRKVDYKSYDEIFELASVAEKKQVALQVAIDRLKYPYKLSVAAKISYTDYVVANGRAAVEMCMNAEEQGTLNWMSANGLLQEEALEHGIRLAQSMNKAELLSWLMNEKHRLFPAKKKEFDL